MNEIAVEAKGLKKTYEKVDAVKGVSFAIPKGELFGLIGPDGAGKTSIFRILTTLILPTEGKAEIFGNDVVKDYKKIRNNIGYMPQRFSLYQDLSVEENLNFFARVFGTSVQENYDLIKDIYIQIEPFKNRLAGKLSGGMKQKLALSCALIHSPDILILDEPTTGVDAVSRKEFWEMLIRLKQKGITIVVSTPYMDEANLCDRVALIQDGRIMKIDKPQNITNEFGRKLWAIKSENIYKLIQDLRQFEFIDTVYPFGEFIHITSKDNSMDINSLILLLKNNNHSKIEMLEVQPNIEDCFMELMNN
ncbi:MAG: ATPase [Bacteroidetes bacterium GWC2_33_15]|nr:MAG: ATPase [Bacteroidetes bacterium GWA2_33_15]OFX48651.1 MAG: ATPase [Bacteroidetes bacterium GWC2_33_15]OFX64625.1 MAG: ATPase [Bacteroidetes bacterium GWB2_32_14]OFX67957.1 MAG: ATPase [Bacteroidetes bacterium GWD2_33_33]HAN18189.1 ATPase [Bacteroidales bacterium]